MGRNFKKFCKVHEPFFIQQMKFSGAFPMQENHYHNSYEIYYLLEGERYYFIKDKTYWIRQSQWGPKSIPMILKTGAKKVVPIFSIAMIFGCR